MNVMRTSCVLIAIILCFTVGAALAASGEGESPWNFTMLLWRVINTAVLIGLLVYFLKKPLSKFFSERKTQIQRDLDEAREQQRKAEELIQEYKQKIAGMEQELDKLRSELKKSAEAEDQKMIANAEKMAATTVEAARLAAEQEVRNAKIALKNEAVDLALKLAETMIREKINEADRQRIVEEYLVKVGGMK
jgi:F-type H+-transporting ATPase subunit b